VNEPARGQSDEGRAIVRKIKIESLGIYLPERVLTTEELLQTCKRRPRLDLERITGIRERRVAVDEFAVDLGVKAAQRALAMSRYNAADLDVIVCTSISKHDRPEEFTLEPATALLVRRVLGAENALVFDVVNACAGMINGIWLMQGLIRAGVARRGMVVSGEHNMPLAWTATRQIRHSLDRQLAALTLGDCGAALILDASPDERYGFHWIDLVTGAKHDHYCYSQPSPRGPGGMLMTKARGLQIRGNQHFPFYLKQALDGSGWSVDNVQHLIPHQVSVRAIRQGSKALERFLGCNLPDVVRCDAEKYGNTTTASHFLALHDFMLRGRIKPGDNVLLVCGASGIVISHATLTLDDLPFRYRAHVDGKQGGESAGAGRELIHPHPTIPTRRPRRNPTSMPSCRIESLGVSPPRRGLWKWGSVRHAIEAGRRCLKASHYHPADVRALINVGVHRDGHICEPANACYIQHALGINVEFQGRRTLAFDLHNGGVGMLNAIHALIALGAAGEVHVGLVVASEANSDRRPDPAYTYPPSGAAVLIDRSPRAGVGFGTFAFNTCAEHAELYSSVVSLREERGRIVLRRRAELEDAYLQGATAAVEEVLATDGLSREDVDLVVPAQISPEFLAKLPVAIGFPPDRVTDFTADLPDTLSTAVFLALHRVQATRTLGPGKVALLLACGSGVTVGAATYHF
jgi:3-oxoacyl-[acyl-carrier-protein] synthase III